MVSARRESPGEARSNGHARNSCNNAIRLKQITMKFVSLVFSVELKALDGPSRGLAKVALARQVVMYLMHVACRLSLADVGRICCRDRTTVRHACAVIEDRRDEPVFDQTIAMLEEIVRHSVAAAGILDLVLE